MLASCSLAANPSGEQVLSGMANFHRNGNQLVVENSDRAIIQWQDFSIASGELTHFEQSSAASSVLNRVVGGNISEIYGTLSSNGEVVLVNPAGVLVGSSGIIDTAAFVASTLDITNEDFLNADYHFIGDSDGEIVNLGEINANGGDLFLVARHISNEGTLMAPDGDIGLASGTEVLIQGSGAGGVIVDVIDGGEPMEGDGIDNSGIIEATKVKLEAAGGNPYALAINNTGTINATSATVGEDGAVYLSGNGGDVVSSGTITAKDADGTGGYVEITGNRVALTGTATVDVSGDNGGGEFLLGGDFQGKNPDIQNAWNTIVQEGVTINADAGITGNGGRIIVWADNYTGFSGSLTAKGGSVSGDGGFAEVSGKITLDMLGEADLTAANGATGELLLDPGNLDITAGASPPPGNATDGLWDAAEDPAIGTTTADSLNQILTTTNLKVISTGTITIKDGAILSYSNGGTRQLWLVANGDIIFEDLGGTPARITATAGALDVILQSDYNADGDGAINMQTNTIINSNGGEIVMSGGSFNTIADLKTLGNAASTTTAGITISGSINSAGGAITLRGTGGGAVGVQTSGSTIDGASLLTVVTPQTANLSGASGSVVSHGNITVNAGQQIVLGNTWLTGNLTLTSGADITDVGNINANIGGSLIANAGTANINLDSAGNNIRNITINAANNASITVNSFTDLKASNISGNFTLNTGGAITQSGALTVGGTSSFSAGGNDITLSHASNDFTGAVTIAGAANLNLNDLNAIDLGNVAATNNFTISAGGAITDSGTLNLTGMGSFNNTAGTDAPITLDSAGNVLPASFFSVSTDANSAVTLVTTGAFDIGAITAGSLDLTASGNITDSGGIVLTNGAIINAGAGDITIDNAGHNIGGSLSLAGANATYSESNPVALGATSLTGNLTVNAVGNITQTAGVTVAGTSTFNSGNNSTILTLAGNDFGTIDLDGNTNVTIKDDNAIILAPFNIGGDLNLTTGGAISTTGAIIVGGNFTIDSGTNDVDLSNAANNLSTLIITASGNLNVVDSDFMNLGGNTITGNLTVSTGGQIIQNGTALTVTGTSSFTATAGNIWFTDPGNDFGGAVSVTTPGNAQFQDANVMDIGNVNVTDFSANSLGGDLTDSGTIIVSGTATLRSNGGSIVLDSAGNNFNNVTLPNSFMVNLNITDVDDIVVGAVGTTMTGNLTVNAGGNVSFGGNMNTTGGTNTINAGSFTHSAGNVWSTGGGSVNITTTDNITMDNATINTTGGNVTFLANGTNIANFQKGIVLNNNAFITTGAGSISLTGTGGGNSADSHQGILITNGSDLTTASGAISLTGTGGAGNQTFNEGIRILGAGTTVSSSGGNISMTGNGSTGTANDGNGITITSSAEVFTTGTGTLTLIGTAAGSGNSWGVSLDGAGRKLETQNGTLSVTGTGSGSFAGVLLNGGLISSIGSGAINVSGTSSGSGPGIWTQTVGSTIGGATATGNITLDSGADALQLDQTVLQTTGAVNLNTGLATNTVTNMTFTTPTLNITSLAGYNTNSLNYAGDLSITANGTIAEGSPITIGGTTTLNAGAGNDINFGGGTSDFQGAVSITAANNVTLMDANVIDFGASTISGNLTTTAVGNITQSGALTVAGTSSFNSGNNSTILNMAGNDFGTIDLDGNTNVNISDDNAVILAPFSVGGALTLATAGNITTTGPITVSGTTTINAGSGQINLSNTANDFNTVNISGGARTWLGDTNDIILGSISTTDAVDVTSGGKITASGAITPGANDVTMVADGQIEIQTNFNLAGAGNISLTSNGTVAGNYAGVYISGGITSTNAGTITINGTGGDTTGNNHGVLINGGNVTTIGGAINITGQGGSAGENHGIYVLNGSDIKATGAGTVSLIGTGSASGQGKGLFLSGAGSEISTSTGNLTITGSGGTGAGGNNVGVLVNSSATLATTDGTMNITGNGGSGAGAGDDGILLASAGKIRATGNGAITLDGNATGGSSNTGINLNDTGTLVEVNNGNLVMTGTANSTSGASYGVYVGASAGIQSIGSGTIDITGDLTSGNGHGVRITGVGGAGTNITGGAANVTITGTGGNNNVAAFQNIGVMMDAGGLITTTTGGISVTGTGGSGSVAGNDGLYMIGSSNITTTAGGNIVINGTGGAASTGNDNKGVVVLGGSTIAAAATGTVNVTGTGSSAAVAGGYGVQVDGAGSKISVVDSAMTVTGTGQGTSAYGVTAFNSGKYESTGTGNISLAGTGSGLEGIRLNNATVGSGTASGVITLNGTGGISSDTVTVETTDTINLVTNATDTFTATNFNAPSMGFTNSVAGIVLPSLNLTGNLTVSAVGAVTDSGNLTIGGTTSLTAIGFDITLDNANDFTGAVSANGLNVVLNDINAIDLGASTVTGTLSVTTTGAITDSGAITAAGLTTLSAMGGNDITLDEAANDFASLAISSANNASITDVNALQTQGVSVSNDLTFNLGGNLTDNTSAITVGGTFTVDAGANNITLDAATSDFNSVNLTGGNVSVIDTNAIDVAFASASAMGITAGGAITDSGNLAVSSILTLTAGANDITLDSAGNDFTTVRINSGNNVTLVDSDNIFLGTSTVSGNLSLTTSGAIGDNNETTTVAGTTTLSAGAGNAIVFDFASTDFGGAVSIASAGQVDLVDANNLTLGAVNISGPLNADVTNNLNVTANVTTGGAGINTFNVGSYTQQTGTTFNTSGQGLNITADDNISIDGGTINSAGGNITLLANGTNAANFSDGIGLYNGASISAGAGAVSLTGTGGSLDASHNIGVYSAGTVQTTTGNITVVGTGTSTAKSYSEGSRVEGVGTGYLSNGGNISITGTSAAATVDQTAGVIVYFGANVTTTGAGTIDISGTSQSTSTNGHGVVVDAGAATLVQSQNGNITITGVGAGASGFGYAQLGTADVLSTGAGNITITGTGSGANQGVSIVNSGATIGGASATGTITINSLSNGLNLSDIVVQTSGGIILDDAGATTINNTSIQGGAGAIDVITDSLALTGATSFTGTGALAFKPKTTTTVMNIGGSAPDVGLQIDGTEYGKFASGGFSSFEYGSTLSTANINIQGLGLTGATTFYTGGDFNVQGGIFNNQALTFEGQGATSDVNITSAMGSGVNLGSFTVNGVRDITAGADITTGGDQVYNATGNIALNGVVLRTTAAGSHTFNGNVVLGGASTIDSTVNGSAVTFNGTVDGAQTFMINSGSGLINFNGVVGGTTALTALNLTSTGNIIQGAAAWNAGTLNANGGNLTIGNAGNDFTGTVTLSTTGNATIADSTALDLGAVTVGGNLNATSAGAMTDSGVINVTGTTTLASGAANDITLDGVANSYGGAVGFTSANNVIFRDSNALALGTTSISGNLTATSAGNITDTGAVAVAGLATFDPGAGNDIVLDNVANDFGTVDLLNASNATFADANGMILAGFTLPGQLSLTAGGNVTQTAAITVPQLELLGAGGTYLLDDLTNDFTTVAANTNALTVKDTTGFDIGTAGSTTGITVTTDTTFETTGTVTQSADLTTSGLELIGTGGDYQLNRSTNQIVTLAANTGTITISDTDGYNVGTVRGTTGVTTTNFQTIASPGAVFNQSSVITTQGLELIGAGGTFNLTDAGNDFDFLAADTGSINIVDVDGFEISTVLGTTGVTLTGDMTLNSGGAVTQSQPIVTNTANLQGSANYTLTHASNDFSGALSANGTGNISVKDANALDFGTFSTTGNLAATTTGNITQSGAMNAALVSLNSGTADITLTNAANTFGDLTLAGNSVSVTEAAAITDGATAWTTTGTTLLNAGANAITLDNAASSTGAIGLSASNATINRTGALTLTNTSLTGALSLTTTGAISQVSGTTLTVGGLTTLSAGTANGITLAETTNDFASVTASNTNNLSLVDANAIDLAGLSLAGEFALTASGDVTQSASITADSLALTAQNVTLTDTANVVNTLAANVTSLDYHNNGSLTIDTVAGVTGITALGTVNLQLPGASSDLLLNSSIQADTLGAYTSMDSTIVLNVGNTFTNEAGSTALDGGSGRFLVYTPDPDQDSFGTLASGKRYNTTHGGTPPASFTEAGDFRLHAIAPVLTVSANPVTVVYGDPVPALSYSVTGFIDNDTESNLVGNASLASAGVTGSNAGTYSITTSSGTLSDEYGYAYQFQDSTVNITKAPLTIQGASYTREEGETNPELTFEYIGLKNGDPSTATPARLSTIADEASPAGTYSIDILDAADSNYDITLMPGTITIKPPIEISEVLDQTENSSGTGGDTGSTTDEGDDATTGTTGSTTDDTNSTTSGGGTTTTSDATEGTTTTTTQTQAFSEDDVGLTPGQVLGIAVDGTLGSEVTVPQELSGALSGAVRQELTNALNDYDESSVVTDDTASTDNTASTQSAASAAATTTTASGPDTGDDFSMAPGESLGVLIDGTIGPIDGPVPPALVISLGPEVRNQLAQALATEETGTPAGEQGNSDADSEQAASEPLTAIVTFPSENPSDDATLQPGDVFTVTIGGGFASPDSPPVTLTLATTPEIMALLSEYMEY